MFAAIYFWSTNWKNKHLRSSRLKKMRKLKNHLCVNLIAFSICTTGPEIKNNMCTVSQLQFIFVFFSSLALSTIYNWNQMKWSEFCWFTLWFCKIFPTDFTHVSHTWARSSNELCPKSYEKKVFNKNCVRERNVSVNRCVVVEDAMIQVRKYCLWIQSTRTRKIN